jgi:transcriptional regulator with XRE-family HTH domain
MGKVYDEILLKKIASRLRELREENGVSQKELHNVTDINIDRIEGAKINVTVGTIQKLCKYFGITLSEFFKTM